MIESYQERESKILQQVDFCDTNSFQNDAEFKFGPDGVLRYASKKQRPFGLILRVSQVNEQSDLISIWQNMEI